MDVPLGLALGAGLLAAVNPCGFALLPAYLSILVLGDDAGPGGQRSATGAGAPPAPVGPARWQPGAALVPVRRALALTGAMTVGFVAVFGAFGLLAAPAADAIARRLPWVSVLIGITLVGLGGWLLAGRQLPVLMPRIASGPAVTLRFVPMVVFGAAYAIASLGCTIGPFLAVVVAGFQAGSVPQGIGLFLAYALGMALAVGAAALAVALARESLVRGMRRTAPVISRISGALLVLTGGYVAWYGWYEIRVFRGVRTDDPVIDAAIRVQRVVSGWLDSLGPAVVAAVVVTLIAGAVGVTFARRRT